jgi:hypothetical protein
VSDELEGKGQSNKACIESKHGGELGLISIYPWPVMRHGDDGFSPSSWEPQEEGMMSTAASFSLRKKPRYVESRKKPNSRR